ncbi:MAG TPA: outer membrane lipoprotein carrier protein LolA [Sandaracinaceae bacterium]
MRRLSATAVAAALLASSAAEAQSAPPTLDALLERFAAAPGFEARFVEEKRIALLAVPVRSEGRIWFAPPGRLMRRVERPDPSAALIADGRLRMRQGERTEEISVEGNAVLRGFVDSFRAVLAGDRAALSRFYRAEYAPAPDGSWQLTLRPRDEALSRFVREIRLRGRGVTIVEMHMIEANGDETRTTFSDVDTARRFSDAEARRIFRID